MRKQIRICTTGDAGRIFTLACALVLSSVLLQGQSNIPSAIVFSLKTQFTVFDGVQMETMLITSDAMSFQTDTFGAWAPLGQPVGLSGFSLRHRTNEDVILDLSVLGSGWSEESNARWRRYQDTVKQQFPGGATLSDTMDSADGPPSIRFLGSRTREAVFTALEGPVGHRLAEHHIFVTIDKQTVVFILRADEQSVHNLASDFHFFVSRLSATGLN